MNNNNNALEDYSKNVWQPTLTEHEKDIIVRYTKNESGVINPILNKGAIQLDDTVRDVVETLSNAISKFELEYDITVFRGVSKNEYEQIIAGHSEYRTKTFLSFKSTSLDSSEADNFSTFPYIDSPYEGMKKHILIVYVPKYSRGAYLGDLSDAQNEKEFLLDKDTSYRVVDIVSNDGTNFAIIEVI